MHVTERAKLWHLTTLVASLALGPIAWSACVQARDGRRAVPSYDPFTGRLIELRADLDGDGRLDQRTYMDGNRPLRGEADTDRDGRVDRWEYFTREAAVARIGTSSRNDGVEDTWTYPAANGEVQIALSRWRDRSIDRREFYRDRALVRAEEDTNADGRTDTWERYEDGALREASFDTTHARGWPNRRVVYDAQGQVVAVEADDTGDGRFVPLQGGLDAAGVKR